MNFAGGSPSVCAGAYNYEAGTGNQKTEYESDLWTIE